MTPGGDEIGDLARALRPVIAAVGEDDAPHARLGAIQPQPAPDQQRRIRVVGSERVHEGHLLCADADRVAAQRPRVGSDQRGQQEFSPVWIRLEKTRSACPSCRSGGL